MVVELGIAAAANCAAVCHRLGTHRVHYYVFMYLALIQYPVMLRHSLSQPLAKASPSDEIQNANSALPKRGIGGQGLFTNHPPAPFKGGRMAQVANEQIADVTFILFFC